MSKNNLVLTGDENLPDMPFKESDVNHLRRLLAWMRCEYMLDEHMQRGYLQGLKESVEHGIVDKARACYELYRMMVRVVGRVQGCLVGPTPAM